MTELRWPLIAGLALLGLVRPVLSITGVYDALGGFGHPWAPLLVTLLIAVVQVAVVVLARVRQPLLTLTFAGLGYGVAAILLNLALQPLLASAEAIPVPGYVAILVGNALQGAVLGLIALGLHRLRKPAQLS
ncbi:hypothetical protein [Actinoplanes friuliensis]|uniref:Integral membrane protein n=1 Tax=Actinoplanes friuliensis DSM 7358 TaxID=1246995 RepID=U5W017_9ACTN|nr:hypothetical protein [Actinoplanes friuliensis]AGZ42543.1 hypothetical protein AFR_21365 [Actinoplanes friuliensis DSM 7358]